VTPRYLTFSSHQISSPKNLSGRGGGIRLVVKSTAALFPTLIAILHSWSHISRSDKWVSRYLTRSAGCLDVATRAVLSAYWASSMWQEGIGMSLTYKLKSTGEITPPCAAPAHMMRQEEVAALQRCRSVGTTGTQGWLACKGGLRSTRNQKL
jgi:hypothetical protein